MPLALGILGISQQAVSSGLLFGFLSMERFRHIMYDEILRYIGVVVSLHIGRVKNENLRRVAT